MIKPGNTIRIMVMSSNDMLVGLRTDRTYKVEESINNSLKIRLDNGKEHILRGNDVQKIPDNVKEVDFAVLIAMLKSKKLTLGTTVCNIAMQPFIVDESEGLFYLRRASDSSDIPSLTASTINSSWFVEERQERVVSTKEAQALLETKFKEKFIIQD